MTHIINKSNPYLINNTFIFEKFINSCKFLVDNYCNIYYEDRDKQTILKIFNDRLLNDTEIKELVKQLNNFESSSWNYNLEEDINIIILDFLKNKPINIPRPFDTSQTHNNYNDILNTTNIIKVLYGSSKQSYCRYAENNSNEINISVHNKNSHQTHLIDDYGNIYTWSSINNWITRNKNKVKLSDNIIKKIKDTKINITEYSMSHTSMPFIIEKKIKEIIKNEENQNIIDNLINENNELKKVINQNIIDNLINENNELKKVINQNKDIEGKFLLKLKELEEIIVNKSKELEDKIKLIETRW
jgi:hypothetical protein